MALAVLVTACSTGPAEEHVAFQPPTDSDLSAVAVTIAVPAGHGADRTRYRRSAITTLTVLGSWLTPFPDATLTIAPERTPWWTTRASMQPEAAVAKAISRRYWERVVDTRALPPAFVTALSEYSARRAVSRIVDQDYFAIYRGRLEGRYFGGFVPGDLRVQLSVEGDGDRGLRTLYTLERWTGRPVFDAILLELARLPKGETPTLGDFSALASRVAGQDLSWLIDAGFVTSGEFDYGVDSLDSRADRDGTFLTTVTVRRHGDAVFARTIPVQTIFADGEIVRERLDGRSAGETFEYRSPARAVSAEVDPEHVLLLDRNRGNNGLTLDTTAARTAATRWSARWMIWLEDALLTYVALT